MTVLRPALCLLFVGVLFSPSLAAEKLTFSQAVELARRHSTMVAIAEAEQARARHSYLEARNAYLPAFSLGSGLAATYGFPLSIEGAAPTIVNLNSQQVLFSPAQRDFVRAARREWSAAGVVEEERRGRATLEAALAYLELAKVMRSLEPLRRQQESAQRLEFVVQERVREGVDGELELTRARLAAARMRLRVAEMEGAADLLRQRLAGLTGLPAAGLEVDETTIPRFPAVDVQEDPATRAVSASPLVRAAQERAAAQEFRARGERRNLYPAVDLVARYGLFSRHNNYDRFFREFQRHNAVFGVNIRFPFFNESLRARADAAEAQVVSVRKEVEAVRNEVSADALHWQRAVRRLQEAREVARLELEVARADTAATQARLEAGQVSLRELEAARIQEQEFHLRCLDAGFALEHARLQFLRATGRLEDWARTASPSP
jgi:outer membrane protein